MVKTYFKTFPRMFKRHFTRLVSIILMVLVSIGFSAGIGMATDKMGFALDDIYTEANLPDFVVKSTRENGFAEKELRLLGYRYGAENLQFGTSLEFKGANLSVNTTQEIFGAPFDINTDIRFDGVGEGVTKVYFADMVPSELAINKITVLEEAPRPEGVSEDAVPVYAERETMQLKGYSLGETFTVTQTTTANTPFGNQTHISVYTFYVAGIVRNPMHFAKLNDVSLQFEENGEQEKLESIFYLFESALAPATNDVYITLPRPQKYENALVLSKEYKQFLEEERSSLEMLLTFDGKMSAEILTLFENFSFASYHEFANKIQGIGYVMMVAFLAVSLLVVLSTMTRLLEEERAQIACLSTLGYSPFGIVFKYLLFALIGTLIGALGAYFVGTGLSYILYVNFDWNYAIPAYPVRTSSVFYFIVASIIVAATLAVTLFAGLSKTREYPANLLRPKAPKPGKKVILERIPLLWNRISFKYKSSLRNVLRYKMRFAMTVVAVMASTALVLAGLAVLDCCIFQDVGTIAMIGVGIVVVFFAALLNFVVIYTLTNINISERNRELATLMVLGYHDPEVAGYVYREIYITSSIGIALGLPLGCLMCLFIFNAMAFGSIPGINWFVWILTPLLSLLFTFLVTVMLSHKILKINMNESLKAIE